MAARTLLLGTLAIALLALVALGSRTEGWTGEGSPRGVSGSALDYGYTIAIIVFVAMLLALVVAFRGGGRPNVERPRGGFVRLALFFAVITFLAYNGILNFERGPNTDESSEDARRRGSPDANAQLEGGREPRDPRFQWWVALVAAGAAGGAYVWLRRRRPPVREQRPREALVDELERVLADTLEDLESEADPRRAVIRAYARMESVLAAHGLPRRVHETPLEFLARMLTELEVRAEAAHALTELFERAKFSQHEIDVAMKREAIAALVSVRDDLRVAA